MNCRGIFKSLLVFLWIAWQSPLAFAQDSTQYRLRVPPFMQIDAVDPDRFATHPMTNANVTFANQRWQARTSSPSGSTVRFSTETPFQHVSSPSFKRDVRLRLTRLTGTTSARWRFDTFDDRTNYAAGDESAAVQVSCRAPGTALIWMNVMFLTGDPATLQGGQYTVTVVGTISEN